MGADLEVEGIEALVSKLETMGRKGSRVINSALKEGAKPMVDDMRKNVRYSKKDHIHIRDNVEISRVKNKSGLRSVDIGPGKETNWRAKFLEFGTSRSPAYPFVGPAFENNVRNTVSIMKTIFKRGLGL